MAENKIVFNFDTKGHEALRRVFQDIQKDTSALSGETAKISNKVSADMNTMLQSFMKFSEAGKALSSLRGDLKQFDQAVSESGQKLAQGFLTGKMTETFKDFQRNLGQIKAEAIAMAREIDRLEAQGKTPEARAKSLEHAAKLSQLGQMETVHAAIKPAFSKADGQVHVDPEKLAEGLARAAGKMPSAGGGAAAAVGGGSGGGGILGGLFGAGGPFAGGNMSMGGLLNYAARLHPGVAAAIAIGGAAMHMGNEAGGIRSVVERDVAMREDRYAPFEAAASGNVLRSMLRSSRGSSANKFLTGQDRGSMYEKVIDSYNLAMGLGLSAFGSKESASAYADRMIRERYESGDEAALKYTGQAQQRYMGFSQANVGLGRMFGDQAMMGSIAGFGAQGYSEDSSRAIRNYIAMYQGRAAASVFDMDLVSSGRRYGMTDSLQQQIARSYGTDTARGVREAGGVIAAAGLGGTQDRYSQQVLYDYIAKQKERMGGEYSVTDVGASAARLIPAAQTAANAALEGTGSSFRVGTLEATQEAVKADASYKEAFSSPGNIRNAMVRAKLMAMGLPHGEALALSMMPPGEQTAKTIAKVLQSKGLNPKATPESVSADLSSATAPLTKAMESTFGFSAAFKTATGLDEVGFAVSGSADNIARNQTMGAAERGGWGGVKGDANFDKMPKESKQTAADALDESRGKQEAASLAIVNNLEEVRKAILMGSDKVVEAIKEEKATQGGKITAPLLSPVTRTPGSTMGK